MAENSSVSYPEASIIIPAHNEARTIGRLLRMLVSPGEPARFEIIVVCNGCSDDTAKIAREYPVIVRELAEPSKRAAMHDGDSAATIYPRMFVDADVEIKADDLHHLVDALSSGEFLASGPTRVVPRAGVQRLVAWYYDVWEALPQTSSGLFGRGVIALSESGSERVRALTMSMSDDLVIAEAFDTGERTIVDDAKVVVHPPKTFGDLLRRRVRVYTGNAEADAVNARKEESRTSWRTLARLAGSNPRHVVKVPVFVSVALIGRIRASRAVRTGDFTTWQRDESSRT